MKNNNMLVFGVVVVLLIIAGVFLVKGQTKNSMTTGNNAGDSTVTELEDEDENEREDDDDEAGDDDAISAPIVEIKNFAFAPNKLEIKAGSSVTFTNQDSVGHTATADDKSFDTGMLQKGQSETITFDKPGTYAYHCTPHPNMKATIVVEE